MKIENSVALVTGANRGIGAALVEALLDFAKRHVKVFSVFPGAVDRRPR